MMMRLRAVFPWIAVGLAMGLTLSSAWAGGQRVAGLVEARQAAPLQDEPIVALIWGEWLPASALLRQRIWESQGLTQGLEGSPVLCAVGLVEQAPGGGPAEPDAGPDPRLAEFKALHGENWSEGVPQRLTVPAIYFYSESGRWLASLEGEELRALNTAEELIQALNARLAVVRQSNELERRLEAARTEGNRDRQLEILVQLADLPVPKPKDLADQLRALDPQDASGWLARLEFPGWGLVASSGARAKSGEALQVVQELQQMLEKSGYTDEQRAMIHAAWGNALRNSSQPQEAVAQFEEAARLDPDGVVGQSAQAVAKLVGGEG